MVLIYVNLFLDKTFVIAFVFHLVYSSDLWFKELQFSGGKEKEKKTFISFKGNEREMETSSIVNIILI